MFYSKTQSGVALIAALLAVALATAAAVYLTSQNELYKRRTGNLLNSDQAYQYAIGMEAFAMALLYEDAKESKIDTLQEDWALINPTFEIPGGMVTGRLTDLQGRYNINNLLGNTANNPTNNDQNNRNDADREENKPPPPPPPIAPNQAQTQFRKLLAQFENSVEITDALIDWMDADLSTRGINGAEDQYYLGLEKPYRTGNRGISHISELRLIKDMHDELYRSLEPFITVLPTQTRINVNTAPAEVLVSLGLEPSIATSLVSERDEMPFESVNAFLEHPIVAPLKLTPNDITTTTQFFLLQSVAVIDRGSSSINSVLYRDQSGKMRVIYRSLEAL